MTADAATLADALEPCPFCGGEAEATEWRSLKFYVICTVCLCRTDYERCEADAIAAWNKRSHSAPPAEEVMEVVDILKGVSAFLHVHDAPDMLFNATEKAIALLGLSHALSRLQGEEMVEKLARVMWIDTTDKDYWDHLDEDTKNIYRGNAVAVLSTIQEEIKNG